MPRQQREVNAFCDLFDKLVWFVTRFFTAARIIAETPEKRTGARRFVQHLWRTWALEYLLNPARAPLSFRWFSRQ
jgi:hypothetical protein